MMRITSTNIIRIWSSRKKGYVALMLPGFLAFVEAFPQPVVTIHQPTSVSISFNCKCVYKRIPSFHVHWYSWIRPTSKHFKASKHIRQFTCFGNAFCSLSVDMCYFLYVCCWIACNEYVWKVIASRHSFRTQRKGRKRIFRDTFELGFGKQS